MNKKILAMLLVLTMMISIFAGCGKSGDEDTSKDVGETPVEKQKDGEEKEDSDEDDSGLPEYMNEDLESFPITKDNIKVKLMGSRTPAQGPWDEMDVMTKMMELTNIDFEYDTPPANAYAEKKNLAFAGGELPDVFLGGRLTKEDEETYGPQGYLLPLEGYIDQYTPHLKVLLDERPDVKKAITASDGHIYALPYVVNTKTMGSGMLYINMQWLENVNMDKPTNVDELYDVMKAFKEKDPNKNGSPDEIPISSEKLGMLNTTILNAFTGSAGGADFDIKDDKVFFTPIEDSYKEYLVYLNKLYTEKLLDNESFTQTREQLSAKGKEGRIGILTRSVSVMLNPDNYDPHEFIAPLTSQFNDKRVTAEMPGISTGTFAITKECKYPEAMMRWIDVFYRKPEHAVEGLSGMAWFLGIEGEHWGFTDSEETKFFRKQKDPDISAVENTMKYYTPGTTGALAGWTETKAVADGDPFMLLKAEEMDKHYFPNTIATYPTTVRFTEEETEKAMTLQADIESYVEQMSAKFIVGEESLDNWDEYVKTLKQMGIEELTKIRQDGYDRWNKN